MRWSIFEIWNMKEARVSKYARRGFMLTIGGYVLIMIMENVVFGWLGIGGEVPLYTTLTLIVGGAMFSIGVYLLACYARYRRLEEMAKITNAATRKRYNFREKSSKYGQTGPIKTWEEEDHGK